MQSENWTIYPEKCFEHDSSWAKSSLNGFNLSNIFRVNQKMEEDPNSTHDFLTLVGLVSYYGSGEED